MKYLIDIKDFRVSPILTERLLVVLMLITGILSAKAESQEGTSTHEIDVFDINSLPSISISVSGTDWNTLLEKYDEDKYTRNYIKCKFCFLKDGEQTVIEEAGLRLHGNTSRRRPEGKTGQFHGEPNIMFNHCHYMVNTRKYIKDDDHELGGYRKINFKWFHNDPSYVREIYCYDLFRRFGIWTIANSSYCRMTLNIDEEDPVYLGVYGMFEVVDKQYLKRRQEQFGSASGFLWKCGGVGLNKTNDNLFFIDDNTSDKHPYELKENTDEFDVAKTQLCSFIRKFNELQGDEFLQWFSSVCDVEFLLRTYAVNVACGMWDDYWNNSNNYYVYFNSKDENNYKFFFIPFDYDESLGRTSICGVQTDAVTHNPLNWGRENNKLISKVISYPQYRKIYINALYELSSQDAKYLNVDASIERINQWHELINNYVENDTGQDMAIEDLPGMWSDSQKYRLWTKDENNFFKIKCAEIEKIYKSETTGISSFESKEKDSSLFSLSGIKIKEPSNGLYIKNRKKYLKK